MTVSMPKCAFCGKIVSLETYHCVRRCNNSPETGYYHLCCEPCKQSWRDGNSDPCLVCEPTRNPKIQDRSVCSLTQVIMK